MTSTLKTSTLTDVRRMRCARRNSKDENFSKHKVTIHPGPHVIPRRARLVDMHLKMELDLNRGADDKADRDSNSGADDDSRSWLVIESP
jgi:hypothetical protein